MTSPEQKARANRALIHYHFTMAFLSSGDTNAANDYLKDVIERDGRDMYQSVVDMIALVTKVPPIEP